MDFVCIFLCRDERAVLSSGYHDILFLSCVFFCLFCFLVFIAFFAVDVHSVFLLVSVETSLIFPLEKACLSHRGFDHFLFPF